MTRARGRQARRIASRYDWDDVASRYERLCSNLAEQGQSRRSERPSGRRAGIDTDFAPLILPASGDAPSDDSQGSTLNHMAQAG